MMHPIICKYARRNFAIPVIGEMYYLDKDSIAIMDGETYGNIYRMVIFIERKKMEILHFSHSYR